MSRHFLNQTCTTLVLSSCRNTMCHVYFSLAICLDKFPYMLSSVYQSHPFFPALIFTFFVNKVLIAPKFTYFAEIIFYLNDCLAIMQIHRRIKIKKINLFSNDKFIRYDNLLSSFKCLPILMSRKYFSALFLFFGLLQFYSLNNQIKALVTLCI